MKPKEETVFFCRGIAIGLAGIIVILIVLLIVMTPGISPGSGTGKDITESAPAKEPVKTARPSVDLYVMSFCPYGTQAETVLQPVYELLGAKTDIRIRYITTVTGTTIDSVNSLHGITEAKEDSFQACLAESSPVAYWQYLRRFNTECYPVWKNSTALDACRRNVTAALSVDLAGVEACSRGTEGIALLKADEKAALADGASASPTLVINGQVYSGARTPEAYKQAVCSAFETEPEECTSVLPDSSVSASGGCG